MIIQPYVVLQAKERQVKAIQPYVAIQARVSQGMIILFYVLIQAWAKHAEYRKVKANEQAKLWYGLIGSIYGCVMPMFG